MAFSFGRDANINFKHGINALAPEAQTGKGRISIILWGLAKGVIEEEGSPPMLGSDGVGPHSGGSSYGKIVMAVAINMGAALGKKS